MRVYQLTCDMTVPKPIAEVFAVFEDPYNLKQITPPSLNFSVTTKERVVMRVGAEIEYRLAWNGVPLRWKTIITAYQPPYSFVDEQAKGPYVLWRHRHTFEEVEEGTLVRDCVDYVLPLGPLGWLAHALAVKSNLIEIFRFRQQALNEMWGSESRINWPTVRTLSRDSSTA